jgi:hypothetical protein
MSFGENSRPTLIVLAIFLGAFQPTSAAEVWSPQPDQIAHLEKRLVLPPGARPLGEYGRYYWGTTDKGKKVIRGELNFGQPIGVHIVDQPPLGPTDQGCRRVYVWYELAKDKLSIQCDGVG